MSKTTTWMVSMKKLAAQGELGSIMVRLMMVLQDFAMANHAMEAWKSEKSRKLQCRKVGASRYFLRLQIAHLFEAFEIIRNEIEKSAGLKAAIEACDAQTKKSYQSLLQFMQGDDYKLMLRIRNNVAFHYDPKVVLQSLARLPKRQEKKREENMYADDNLALTLGNDALDWYFKATEWVENDIIVHGIFGLPQDEKPADLQVRTDDIVMRLHATAGVFADFAGHFVKHHVKK